MGGLRIPWTVAGVALRALDGSLVVLRPAERLSCRRDITGLSLNWCVGDAGNTSLVDAGTPLGATAVVTPGSAGYLLWECCILASL